MHLNRREFFQLAGPAIAGIEIACSNETSTSITRPSPTPVPQQRVELLPATSNYTFVVKAIDQIPTVRQALELAGLQLKVHEKSNWGTTNGTFAGAYVEKINNLPDRGQWLLNFGDKQFCGDVNNQDVPAGTIIGCHIDDGKHRTFTC